MPDMETAVRWSSNSTLSEQRFLLADINTHTFKHCKVEKYDGKSFLYGTVSANSNLRPFRAFDWAPFDESLVAAGDVSGMITVLRIDDVSSGIYLPAKNQRMCNAVAIGRTGLVAAGLERVRSDFCLNIWDVNQRLQAAPSPEMVSTRASPRFVEPYRKLASSESVSSIKFFASQPEVLLVGVKGSGVRMYDLRENVGTPSLHYQTSSVHCLAIDPLDENCFACASAQGDTTVQVWDRRSGSAYTTATVGANPEVIERERPVLEYREAFGNSQTPDPINVWSLKYCKGKSGCLGALANTGELKVFETKHEYSSLTEQHKAQQHPDYEMAIQNEYSILTKRIHHIESAYGKHQGDGPDNERIVAFDLTNLAGARGTPTAIILRADESVSITELNGPAPALSISPLGDMLVSKTHNSTLHQSDTSHQDPFINATVRKFSARGEGRIRELFKEFRENSGSTPSKHQRAKLDDHSVAGEEPRSSRALHEDSIRSLFSGKRLDTEDALTFSTVARYRAAQGYLFDSGKNVEILQDDPWLQAMWDWIGDAKAKAEDGSMLADAFDLSFFGVFGIWNNDLDSYRASNQASKPTYSKEVADAINMLCDTLKLPQFRATETSCPKQRQLCLYACGYSLSYEELEYEVKRLSDRGETTKATALAIIHDQVKLALQMLKIGDSSPPHRELSLALAGYAKGGTDDGWHEAIQDLASGIDDPYARAILALVSHGDWHDVLLETSVPLRDRVGIALMHLDDEELTQYINDHTADSIEHGDIEGVVLTGLTESAVPLFENYIRKFSDLQTAVLAMSIASPRYFSDPRVDLWRETYRSYLNDWRMFIPRVKFDVQCTKLSILPDSKPGLQPPPPQVTLRCNNCDQALDHNANNMPPQTSATIFGTGTHQGSIFGGDKSGTLCPKCGRHMPRCVVCMHWLGMPDPHSRGSVAAAPSRKEQLSKFVNVCRNCWHMSHGGHAEEWFAGHDVCPVPDCDCNCLEIDVGIGF